MVPSRFAGTTISRGDLGRARRAVFGPWCEIHLAPGLERGLLVVFRQDHPPEGLGSDHREGEGGSVHESLIDNKVSFFFINNYLHAVSRQHHPR